MYKPRPESSYNQPLAERGQALIEYALITVLVGIAFGLAIAASAPVTGNLFNAVVNDMLRQTVVGDVPNPDEFWGTVTGVFQYTPTGAALPTNTKLPPKPQPTAGPSPTHTATYTPTEVMPSSTPEPTRTPVDVLKSAPFLDTVDQPDWWRIDSNIARGLRGHPWNVEAWNNTEFNGTPDFTKSGEWELKFNGGPFFAGVNDDNFSARFTRTIEIDAASAPKVVNFRVVADDGVDMTLNGAAVSLTNGSGQNASLDGNNLDLYTGTATLPEGTHTVVVSYKATGGASSAVLRVDIVGGGANPDDTAIDGSGNATSGEFSCNWGPLDNADDANTKAKLFDDYVGGQNRAGTLCYLEFRGAVVIPPDAADMQLHFWDVWEFDDDGADGWIEVAQYIPTSTTPTVNRDAFVWQKIPLGRIGTKNFNWTHNVIDLQPYIQGWDPRYLAFRFVMQVPQGVANGVGRQWLIDDVEFKRKTEKVFTVDRMWTLNNADERFDFIRSGGTSNTGLKSGWHLVSNNKLGPNGLAFHDSANDAYDDATQIAWIGGTLATSYKPLSIQPASSFESDVRMHTLEFDGWIDLSTVPAIDSFGNTGEPVLSFYHAYDLGSRTGLSVQYSTSPYGATPAEWKTFAVGELRSVSASGPAQSLTMQEEVISLTGLTDNPPRIRIRFVMLIHKQATEADGWWIDQIRLGRAENDKWLNYPFFDDAQAQQPLYFWRYTGSWSSTTLRGHYRTNAVADDVEMSYASSPLTNYTDGQTSHMTMRWPIDLYNDTPDKQVIVEAGALAQPSNTFGAPATANSVLSFYHWRELARNDDLVVEWKRASEPDSSYRMLWLYRYGMSTNSTGAAPKTGMNRTWQYTRVSLYPIFRQFATDNNGAPGVGTGNQLTDDDIVIRFGLKADGSQNAAGVFVDDIQIEESTMRTVRLWPASQNRVDPSLPVNQQQPLGNGTGSFFFSEPDGTSDGRAYTQDWKMGGQWQPQRFDKRKGNGLFAFHDSVRGGQDRAPSGYRLETGSDDFGNSAWYTRHQTFSVLDLNREFDLRAVDAETESPQLSFWTRYHIGADDYIRVEVSTWDARAVAAIDSSMSGRCANQPVLQCYEQERGWSEWTSIWSVGSKDSPTLSYGWRKTSLDLRPYSYSAASGSAGKKIRIRFVYDAYEVDANYDGWYIDGVEMSHRLPALASTDVESTVWVDDAKSVTNWIFEGSWGLDQNIFWSSGSGPVNLGDWTGNWWHCPNNSTDPVRDCEQRGTDDGAAGSNRFRVGANLFLQDPARPAPDRTATYSLIDRNFGSGSPIAGWPATNEILAEFTIDITVDGINFQPGPRSFSTRSDDGVRLKIEKFDETTGLLVKDSAFEWNIINNWTDHPATTDSGITPEHLSFLPFVRYRLTLQYYDKSGDGLIQMTASTGSTSFSDSPKVAGGLTPDVPPIPRANTSLLGRHVFDLTNFSSANIPVLEIHTKYRMDDNTTANVEVSSDGGFNWSKTNLDKNAFGVNYSNPTWGGVSSGFDAQPDSSDWQVKQFNLNSYEGRHVIIRLRFDRLNTSCYSNHDCDDSAAYANPDLALKDGYYDGWWIGFMRMGRVGPAS